MLFDICVEISAIFLAQRATKSHYFPKFRENCDRDLYKSVTQRIKKAVGI